MNWIKQELISVPNGEKLIRDLLSIQESAYQQIAEGLVDTSDYADLLLTLGSSPTEIANKARERFEMYYEFGRVSNYDRIEMLPDEEIATLRSILWKMEDTYILHRGWDKAVSVMWDVLFQIEENRKPRLAMTLSINKNKRKQ